MQFYSLLLLIAIVVFCSGDTTPIEWNLIPFDWAAVSARTADGRAPLYGLDSADRINDEYAVTLYDDHSLEDHCQAIGRDVSEFLKFKKFSFGHRAKFDDESLLDLVRWDPGVRFVDTSQRVYLIEPVERKGKRTGGRVDAYVPDTGTNTDHEAFLGHAKNLV